jgi:glycosyltransferase involved in cell wall biosynthesis
MPSVNEGFGMAALEAMAHGLPVVGMRSGALPELIVDQETGLLAEVTEPGSLVSHLARLLENAELRTRLGAASQESVAQRFSPREMAIRTGAFYESLLGLAPGSGQLQRQ